MSDPQLLIGTASFADRQLLATGRFYPRALPARDRLRHYASIFPLVEIDSSYYALPEPATTHTWASGTPAGFTINLKAFRALTGHQTPRAALPADLRAELPSGDDVVFASSLPGDIRDELWRRFALALEPLRMAGRLGAVLFQFPAWVRAGPAGTALVQHCASRLEGCLPAVELRHRSWFATPARTADTLALLREVGAVHVVVDAPPGMADAVPAVWAATRPELAMVRLHGRNAAGWRYRGPGSHGRFDYRYGATELDELARAARRLARSAQSTHVVFNTNRDDQGVANARDFAAALARLGGQ